MMGLRLDERALARGVASVARWLALGADEGVSRPREHPTPARATGSASGASSQIEDWFTRYQAQLLDYLYGMTHDHEWAADLTQETFLRAYSAVQRESTTIEQPRAWLYRIATNVALSALRRRRRFDWLPLSAFEPEPGQSGEHWRPAMPELSALRGPDPAATVAERDAVWSTLAELPPRWRAALLMQAAGFVPREVAAQLGVTEASARKTLFRAKERFRQLIARHAEAEARGGAQ